jgi:lysophospholipase L1-like esterase
MITAFNVSLTQGDIIGFNDNTLYDTHEFAIGKNTDSTWIGGGYLHSNYTIQTTGIYTIMIHNTSSVNIYNNASNYNIIFGKLMIEDVYTNALKEKVDLLSPDVESIKENINYKLNSYLYGKKIIATGDSMVKGHTLSDSQTWLYKLATRNNMQYVNYGINGCCLSYNSIGTGYDINDSVVNRFDQMVNDADIIVVFVGTNDINTDSIELGTIDSTDKTTFMGALNILCDGLITKYPNKKICFITPYYRVTRDSVKSRSISFSDAIETICNNYSIPVFNNVKNGGICWSNIAQVNALTLGDTFHLNESGHQYASTKYEAFINTL